MSGGEAPPEGLPSSDHDEEFYPMADTPRMPGMPAAVEALATQARQKRQERLDKAQRRDLSSLRDRRSAQLAGSVALGSNSRRRAG